MIHLLTTKQIDKQFIILEKKTNSGFSNPMISPFDICFKLSKQKKTTMFPIDTPFLVDVPREKTTITD